MNKKINLRKIAEKGDTEKSKSALDKIIFGILDEPEKVSELFIYDMMSESLFKEETEVEKTCNSFIKLLKSLKQFCKTEETKIKLLQLTFFFEELKSDPYLQVYLHHCQLWDENISPKRVEKIVSFYLNPKE